MRAHHRRAGLAGWLLALGIACALPALSAPAQQPQAGTAAPVTGEPAPASPPQEQPPPADDVSLQDLLAAERSEELAAAAGDRLPFRLRAESLKGLPAGMAALIIGGGSGGQIVNVPLAAPLLLPLGGGEAATARVSLLVEIDGSSLLGPSPPAAPRVEIYAYAITPGGEVRGFLSQGFTVDLDELGEAVYEGGVKFVGHLQLPPGGYSLRVLVHVADSQRYGMSTQDLEVPDGAGLLIPFAEEPEAPWLLVAESAYDRSDPAGTPEPRIEQLLARAGTALPSALPILGGQAPEVDVFLAGAAGAPEPAQLAARLSDLEGAVKATFEAPVLRRDPTELPGIDRLRVSLPLSGVETGSYRLTLTAPGIGGRDLTSPALPVVVLPGEASAHVWTEIQRRIAGDAARPASLDLGAQRRRRGHQERVEKAVAAAYRQILGRLARGDHAAALDDLTRIEKELLASGAELPFELLATAEGGVLERLAALDPEAVLPVIPFAAATYDSYRDSHDFGLASHSRRMAQKAAEIYATRTGTEQGRTLAAETLAQLGAELQASFVLVAGRELLERALVLDPGNRFALLNLAAGHEKTAEYQQAVDLLQRVVGVDVKSPEGRLRLGVNLIRLGRTSEGLAILERLVREDNPPWVLSVAYETMAEQGLESGDPAAAAALLGQAAGRLPDEGRLAIQRAYALERAGRPVEATQAIERLRPQPSSPSPRNRYTRWPEDERERIAAELDQASMVRMPSLASALERLPAADGGGR